MIDPFKISLDIRDRVGERSRTPPPMNSIGSMALPSAHFDPAQRNAAQGKPFQ
jgi:hypothetical protein